VLSVQGANVAGLGLANIDLAERADSPARTTLTTSVWRAKSLSRNHMCASRCSPRAALRGHGSRVVDALPPPILALSRPYPDLTLGRF